MRARQKKLCGLFAMIIFACTGLGLYLYVIFHYHHVWSVLLILGLLLFAFFTPAIAFGYNNDDPALMDIGRMSLEGFLLCRDVGYALAAMFFLLTYVAPTIAWYGSGGVRPNVYATVSIYIANTLFAWSFILLWVIFIQA